jgi:hypothetical protein
VSDPLIEAVRPPTKWYVVLRPFKGDRAFVRGEVVDVTGWTHLTSLVQNRYVDALPHGAEVPDENADGIRIIELSKEQARKVAPKKRPIPKREQATSS